MKLTLDHEYELSQPFHMRNLHTCTCMKVVKMSLKNNLSHKAENCVEIVSQHVVYKVGTSQKLSFVIVFMPQGEF